MIAGYRRCRT